MFGIPFDKLEEVLGGSAAFCIIGVLTWLSSKRNKADADSSPHSSTSMGLVLDADTGNSILHELRDLNTNIRQWREEELVRAKDDRIEELEHRLSTLAGGQKTTHGNQGDMLQMLAEMRDALTPEVIDEVREHRRIRHHKD